MLPVDGQGERKCGVVATLIEAYILSLVEA